VPFRNVERYLQACLDSLFAQTRPIDELILVDDRSTDDTAAIAERAARARPNVKIIRGPGRGAAAARNLGLQHATGDYLAFADADDVLEPDMYERMVRLLERENLDMALCNARYHFEGREADRPVFAHAALAGPVSGSEWLAHKLESREFLHAVWMHLYRRAFLEDNRLRFTEGLMHEDVTWTTRALMLAKRVAYVDAPLYAYRRQPREFTRQALDERLRRVIETAMVDARMLEDMAKQADPRLARAIRWQLVDGGLSVFHKIRQLSSPSLRRQETAKVKKAKYFGLLWRNADARQRRKLASRYVKALFA
jgi:heptose III glucuronosyltransferase